MTATRRHRFRATATGIGVIAPAMLLGVACSSTGEQAKAPTTGPAIYREVCATCHGRQGGGFVGPSLIDVADRYPDVAAEIALVTNGSGEMPGLGTILSQEQIATVVAYTREKFSSAPATTTTSAPFVGPVAPTTSTSPTT